MILSVTVYCVYYIMYTINDARGSKYVRSEKKCSEPSPSVPCPRHPLPFSRRNQCYQLVYLSRDILCISMDYLCISTKAYFVLCSVPCIGDGSTSIHRSHPSVGFLAMPDLPDRYRWTFQFLSSFFPSSLSPPFLPPFLPSFLPSLLQTVLQGVTLSNLHLFNWVCRIKSSQWDWWCVHLEF